MKNDWRPIETMPDGVVLIGGLRVRRRLPGGRDSTVARVGVGQRSHTQHDRIVDMHGYRLIGVTHWQPLPEAPG